VRELALRTREGGRGKGKKKNQRRRRRRSGASHEVATQCEDNEPAEGEYGGSKDNGHADEGLKEEEECSICLRELSRDRVAQSGEGEEGGEQEEEGEQPEALECGHAFHSRCLVLWASKCSEKRLEATCPICRGAFHVRGTGGS